MSKKIKKKKLCLISSSGGHFYQMMQLEGWWKKHQRFWVTSKKADTEDALKDEKVYWGYFPENRNVVNAIRNLLLAIKILKVEKPDIVFSTGAGIAPPFFLLGKLMGIRLIYLETASYIGIRTLSGRLIHPIADIFLVQHRKSLELYKKAQYKGGLI